MTNAQTIAPSQVALIKEHALLLDVRTPAEYQEMHINGAVLHPLSELNLEHIKQLLHGKSEGVVVCRSGSRARQASEKLLSAGLSNLKVLEGGVAAWEAAGLALVRGKRAISLERQVRIAAGALVVIGAILSYFVNPAFITLSAFVGAGLMFAGITDTCGLAMALTRMPWNTRGVSCCSAASDKNSCSSN
jgi:rhodanese-related sulfurtransferase